MTPRVRALLLLLALIVAFKLGAQWVRWATSTDERARITALRERVVDAGVEVVRTEARADTLLREIEARDSVLERKWTKVDRFASLARNGTSSSGLYTRYRRELARYNEGVEARNLRFRAWREVRARRDAAWERYTRLADSIHGVAAEIGEPYYPVPLPIEAAAEQGLIRVDP